MSRYDRNRFITALLAVLAIGGVSLSLTAAYAPAWARGWDVSPDSVDRAMVTLLSRANRDEVATSRAALPGLQDPEVKRFAQRMIDDHSAALTAISTIATRLKYPLAPQAAVPAPAPASTPAAAAPATTPPPANSYSPGTGSPTTTSAAATPAATASSTADPDYLTSQVSAHESLLSELPTDMTSIKDAGLRQHVTDTKRSVQMHLDDAKRLQNRRPGGTP